MSLQPFQLIKQYETVKQNETENMSFKKIAQLIKIPVDKKCEVIDKSNYNWYIKLENLETCM